MTNRHGDFIWYELLTSDPSAAADFYGAVFGWAATPFDGGNHEYHVLSIEGEGIGGLMKVDPSMGCGDGKAAWFGYIGVDDVDKSAAAIVKAGGAQHVPPTDIPNVGRFAMMADPQGVKFYVMRGAVEGTSAAFKTMAPGHCNWNELTTSDQIAALQFYSDQFGWQKGDAMSMGEVGDYQFIVQGPDVIGAIMNAMPGSPALTWTFYFGVNDIDAAAKTVHDKGGVVHYGPTEVPGGSFIIVASDPSGAMFGAVGQRHM